MLQITHDNTSWSWITFFETHCTKDLGSYGNFLILATDLTCSNRSGDHIKFIKVETQAVFSSLINIHYYNDSCSQWHWNSLIWDGNTYSYAQVLNHHQFLLKSIVFIYSLWTWIYIWICAPQLLSFLRH